MPDSLQPVDCLWNSLGQNTPGDLPNPEMEPMSPALQADSLQAEPQGSGLDNKASACNAEDPGLIPGLGRSLGERNDNPLQYSCLENSMDRGAL